MPRPRPRRVGRRASLARGSPVASPKGERQTPPRGPSGLVRGPSGQAVERTSDGSASRSNRRRRTIPKGNRTPRRGATFAQAAAARQGRRANRGQKSAPIRSGSRGHRGAATGSRHELQRLCLHLHVGRGRAKAATPPDHRPRSPDDRDRRTQPRRQQPQPTGASHPPGPRRRRTGRNAAELRATASAIREALQR